MAARRAANLVGGPEEDLACLGHGAILDRGLYKTSIAVPLSRIPKYRKRVLFGKVAIRLKRMFYEAARVNRWCIRELNIQQDHVHMLLQLSPNISVARAVQHLKGGTSFKLRKEFPELEEFLWGDSF